MITIDQEGLYNNIVDFLNKLDRDKTYTALFIAESWNYNRVVATLSEHSILIHKDFDPKLLTEIIEIDINKFMSKYLNNKYENIVDFKISVQYREWLDEKQYGKDKFIKIKDFINKDCLNKLRKLTSLNKIVSEDVNIINGLKYMKFFDFNLPYNYWFEKELFFKNIIQNNLIKFNKDNSFDLGAEDIIKLYNIFLDTLKDDSEYLIDIGNKKDSLKIVFTNVDEINIKMVNDCSKYNIKDKIFIRQAEILMVDNTKGDIKSLVKWIDIIGLDKNLFNDLFKKNTNTNNINVLNKIIYFNSYRIVERHVDKIKFTWDTIFKPTYLTKFDKIYNIKDLFKIIRPIDSIFIFKNFEQDFKLDIMEELPHEQMFNNKIGVIDLETCPEKSEVITNEVDEVGNKIYNNNGSQKVYAGGWSVGSEKQLYYYGDPGCENQDGLIKKMITDIFESGYAKYTFYVHNLGKFDGHFMIKSLLVDLPNTEKFEDVKIIVGDSNDIIQIKIKRTKGDNR